MTKRGRTASGADERAPCGVLCDREQRNSASGRYSVWNGDVASVNGRTARAALSVSVPGEPEQEWGGYEMAFVFHRTLAMPLTAVAFLTVALTAPPATVFVTPSTALLVIAVLGIAPLVCSTPGALAWLRMSRARVRVRPPGHRDHAGVLEGVRQFSS
jgi:hypothetical protein